MILEKPAKTRLSIHAGDERLFESKELLSIDVATKLGQDMVFAFLPNADYMIWHAKGNTWEAKWNTLKFVVEYLQ